jgi:hypothetical protein
MNSLAARNIQYSVTIHFVLSHLTPNSLCLTEYRSYLVLSILGKLGSTKKKKKNVQQTGNTSDNFSRCSKGLNNANLLSISFLSNFGGIKNFKFLSFFHNSKKVFKLVTNQNNSNSCQTSRYR